MIMYHFQNPFMRRSAYLILILLGIVAVVFAPPAPAQNPQAKNEIRIWKNGAPNSNPKYWPNPNYKEEWQNNNQLVVGVTEPTVCAFLPTKETSTGVAVIICPGGGYQNVYIEKEGYKIALALQERGIAGIVLKYRHYDIYAALEDAHRAIRFVRSKAKEWYINPQAVGIGGFSAGGHLALHSATNLSRAERWTHDEIDQMSKKPDFLMLVYPSLSIPKEASIDANTPASFIVNAADDTLTTPESAIEYFSTLKRLKVPAELHIYEKGFHGFGLGTPECQCGNWIDLFRNWLVVNKFVNPGQPAPTFQADRATRSVLAQSNSLNPIAHSGALYAK
jgi:acetyl esterase/lipase